ncbi:ClpXP protease specificity-enhancing factor SspB, partial [Rhizobium ruizarguesonis]
EQMTIVIQHQFWDMKITETHFEIGLSFSDVPEKLVIPFNAIRGFYDPSVNFELEFDVPLADGEELPSGEITAYPVD